MRIRLLAGSLVLSLLAVGCSSSDPDEPQRTLDPPTVSPPPPRQVFDPPTRFDPAGLALGDARPADVLLHGPLVFVAGATGLTVTDVVTGRQVGVLTPPHPIVTGVPALGARVAYTPALVERGGQPAVVVPYPVSIPAEGTTAARQAVELVVADAGTGQQLAMISVDAAPAEGVNTSAAGEDTTVVGARGNVTVLTIGEVTIAVDLATGTTLWRKNGFTAAGVLNDTVVGLTAPDGSYRRTITGLALTDGAKRWSAKTVQQATLSAAGPAFVAVLGEQVDGERFYALVNADGKITHQAQGQYLGGLRCRYDGVAVTVCAIGMSAPLFAVDATTGKDLWQLPATGRVAPIVTAVWHGAVYGTVGGKPLVLDARTGTDKETSPGVAPVAVSGYAGVAADTPGNLLQAYPAAG